MYHQTNEKGIVSKKGLLVLVGCAAGFVLLILALSLNKGFRVISTDPKLNLASIVSPYMDVDFSSGVEAGGLSLYSSQNIISSYSLVNKNDLRIYFKLPLRNNFKYTVTVVSATTIDGKKHSNLKFSFTPTALPSSAISAQQNQYFASHQDQTEAQIYGTTLVNLLPQLGPASEFEITAQTINNVPYIVITGASEQAYQDAQSWITGQGYNVKTLTIKYVSEQPN